MEFMLSLSSNRSCSRARVVRLAYEALTFQADCSNDVQQEVANLSGRWQVLASTND